MWNRTFLLQMLMLLSRDIANPTWICDTRRGTLFYTFRNGFNLNTNNLLFILNRLFFEWMNKLTKNVVLFNAKNKIKLYSNNKNYWNIYHKSLKVTVTVTITFIFFFIFALGITFLHFYKVNISSTKYWNFLFCQKKTKKLGVFLMC